MIGCIHLPLHHAQILVGGKVPDSAIFPTQNCNTPLSFQISILKVVLFLM